MVCVLAGELLSLLYPPPCRNGSDGTNGTNSSFGATPPRARRRCKNTGSAKHGSCARRERKLSPSRRLKPADAVLELHRAVTTEDASEAACSSMPRQLPRA